MCIRDSIEEESEAFFRVVRALKEASNKLMQTNLQRTNAGKDELAYGVAVHFGEVLYGNIGAPARLEFSVVGEAANEVARLEGMTKQLGFATLLSESVARRVVLPTVDLGRHEIAGSDTMLRVYGVNDQAVAATSLEQNRAEQTSSEQVTSDQVTSEQTSAENLQDSK